MEDLELQTATYGTTLEVDGEFDDEGDILIEAISFDASISCYISKESAKALAAHLLAAIEADNTK